MSRTRRLSVIATLLVLSCASCTDSEDPPSSSPTLTSSSTAPSASTSSGTPSVPPYLQEFTATERQAFEEAVASYSTYLERNSNFLAAGATTKKANGFYRRYAIDWVVSWANLAQLANNNVKVSGATRVIWVRPARITLKPSGLTVVSLRRCLDERQLVVTQNGKRLPQPQLKVLHVYRVTLEQRAGETWWRSGVAEQGSPC